MLKLIETSKTSSSESSRVKRSVRKEMEKLKRGKNSNISVSLASKRASQRKRSDLIECSFRYDSSVLFPLRSLSEDKGKKQLLRKSPLSFDLRTEKREKKKFSFCCREKSQNLKWKRAARAINHWRRWHDPERRTRRLVKSNRKSQKKSPQQSLDESFVPFFSAQLDTKSAKARPIWLRITQ